MTDANPVPIRQKTRVELCQEIVALGHTLAKAEAERDHLNKEIPRLALQNANVMLERDEARMMLSAMGQKRADVCADLAVARALLRRAWCCMAPGSTDLENHIDAYLKTTEEAKP